MVRCLGGVAVLSGVLAISGVAWAADWPSFRGPKGDGICTETGLLTDWSSEPKLLWQMKGMGRGFASLAMVGTKAYTMGDRGSDGYVIAIDLATQKELWASKIGAAWTKSNDPGSRGTPTVDGDLMYAVTGNGEMACLETGTGKILWSKNFAKDFGGQMMSGWGYSESPLVDGDKVVVTPGGKSAMMVAMNKKTGEVIWKVNVGDLGGKGKDGAGYSSIVVANIAGVRQYITLVGRGGIGVAAENGKLLWSYNKAANTVANITTPLVKDDLVFLSSAYNNGSGCVRLTSDGQGGVKAEEIYFLDARTFQNHHGGVVLVGDHVYGGHGQNAGLPVCIELATGKVAWKAPRAPAGGSAAVLAYEGGIIFRYEKGALVTLIAADPKEYKVKGQFKLPVDDGPAWSHPVIHDGRLYVRTQDTLMCYDLKK